MKQNRGQSTQHTGVRFTAPVRHADAGKVLCDVGETDRSEFYKAALALCRARRSQKNRFKKSPDVTIRLMPCRAGGPLSATGLVNERIHQVTCQCTQRSQKNGFFMTIAQDSVYPKFRRTTLNCFHQRCQFACQHLFIVFFNLIRGDMGVGNNGCPTK